jgi:hypothetical protein
MRSHYHDANEGDAFTPRLLGGYPRTLEYDGPPNEQSSIFPTPRSVTGPHRSEGALGRYGYNPLGTTVPLTMHATSDSYAAPTLPLDRRQAKAYAKRIPSPDTVSGRSACEEYQAMFASYIGRLAPTLGAGLEIRPSEIGLPKCGDGLFATQDYPRWSLITGVDGDAEAMARREADDADRIRTLSNPTYAVDGFKSDPPPRHRGLGMYANDSFRSPKLSMGLKNNAKFADVEVLDGTLKLCFLVAKEDILAGDEILVSYGPKYWSLHDAQRKNENASASDGEESRSFTFY